MNPATTLTPEALEERAAIAFLEAFVTDRAAGHAPPLAHYLQRFARFEARIAREWLMLTDAAVAQFAVAGPGADGHEAGAIGPYRLLRELGRGAQGVVYLAEDGQLGRRVALKVLAEDVLALSGQATLRLQREAEALARLEHPGLATVYANGRDDGRAWIAMRYVAGGSLQQRLAEQLGRGDGPPRSTASIAAAVRFVERAARALAAAHDAGILHRDIKPGNLLCAADEQPVLVDFGLAADARSGTPTLTAPEAVFGTLAYLPPERLAGAPADRRTDVHALGAVLFEMLTLRRPYQAEVTAHELRAIAEAPLPDVRAHNPAVSRDLATVVATALAKEPVDRYADAAAFADDLERVLTLRPIGARPASPALRLQRWAQRNRLLAQSLAALAVALTAGLAITTWLWRANAASLEEVRRLADLKLARELVAGADQLWPALPDRLDDMRRWQHDLAALRQRLPAHQRRIAGLPAAPTDVTTSWERELLTELLNNHRRLDQLAVEVEGRAALASTVAARSLTDSAAAAAWRAAAARVAASPHYAGLALTPQLGLLPLGADPVSGLEEFAHLLSGAAPSRDAAGALQLDDDSALVMVLVPGGASVLGAERQAPADGHPANVDPETPDEQTPSYAVELAPYFLSRCEMTQAQWLRHTGHNPAAYRVGGGLTKIDSLRHPVEMVTWEECDRVAHELDLVLPSEAQWEHAYRAGSHTPYPFADMQQLRGRENLADVTARDKGTNTRLRFIDWLDDGWLVHAPVGSFAPNAWGFHDMGGNVKEWCDDSWEDYGATAPRDGDGRRRGKFEEYRIVRGGSFSSYLDDVRAAARGGVPKNTNGPEAGLRPARPLR
ncbi:MAG: SUMF1/EgtB/PvdO family nonheme iron enzyme [Planctomycetes bacterium]|nr:SUMF1/EgtB/PvdO family nonheme iron enzyme [Planctomycetota bacterium]